VGPVGPQGPKGDKGDTGLQGADGVQGVQGIPGTSVTAGTLEPGEVCVTGGVAIYNGEDTFVVCNGANGLNGVDGKDGLPGADGINGIAGVNGKDGVSKTVIVHEDGTETEIPALPHTGASSTQDWAIGGIALAVIAGGAGFIAVSRRRGQHSA
jgi:LPXTG-motif cell wall-anchored protein